MAHLPRPDAGGAYGARGAPVCGHAQHVRGIAGRKAGIDGQAFALQTGDSAGQIAVVHIGRFQVHRALAQALPGAPLGIVQAAQVRAVGGQGVRKTHLAGVRDFGLLALEHRQKLRVLVHQQTQGQHAARPDGQALTALQAHFAVAAQTDGIDLDRLDHGPPVAHQGAVKAEFGQAVAHHGNVGGGAAHVGHHGVLQAA